MGTSRERVKTAVLHGSATLLNTTLLQNHFSLLLTGFNVNLFSEWVKDLLSFFIQFGRMEWTYNAFETSFYKETKCSVKK